VRKPRSTTESIPEELLVLVRFIRRQPIKPQTARIR